MFNNRILSYLFRMEPESSVNSTVPPPEDLYLNGSNASTAGSSANGSGNKSSRASSIEALNWSDFEDDTNENVDDDEDSQANTNLLLQSIHSSTIQSDTDSTTSSISKATNADQQQPSTSGSCNVVESTPYFTQKTDEPFEHLDDITSSFEDGRRESGAGDQMFGSYLSIGNESNYGASETSSVAPDQMSNVPVLDDGPIWSKGMKHYRFEENRMINQKLTFGVLLSVVLAVGLGLGNLVAYNECEAELKIIDQKTCSKHIEQTTPLKTTATVSPTIAPFRNSKIMESAAGSHRFGNLDYNHQGSITAPQLKSSKESSESFPEPIIPAKPEKAMVDPNYKLHAQELSRVLKMLDDLSRKIDQFENTTRQLGGIIMMRDEYVKPKSPKSKFLKLLDEITQTKGIEAAARGGKKKHGDSDSQDKDWNTEAEKVLEKIAEAVLKAMTVNSNIISKKEDQLDEEETMLETSIYFPFDDSPIIDDATKPDFDEKDKATPIKNSEHNNKSLENLKMSTLSTTFESKKFGDDSDLEFEYHGESKHEYIKTFDDKVQDFDEFKDKHQKLVGNKEKKIKKNKKEPKKVKKDKPKLDKKKVKPVGKDRNIIQDWQTDRAKLRDENRFQKNHLKQHQQPIFKDINSKKNKNWQIQRDFAREKFREKSTKR